VLGLDYSGGRPAGAAVARAGYGFVVRYLVNGLSGRVNVTAAEVTDMHANGVAVALVWERKIIGQPDRATEGHAAGVADAQAADAQAATVGLPDNPIYFCVDFDIPDYSPGNASARAKLGPVGDYFEGVLSVLPRDRVGVYGGFYAVSRALDAGLAQWAWQTAAWSGGQEDPRIHLFQRVGTVTVDRVDCDVNEARKDDFGQHPTEDIVTSPQDIAAAVWAYRLPNPAYDPKADPATGPGKKDFEAGDYLTATDMFVQALAPLIGREEAELLAAFKAASPAQVDTSALAEAIIAAGLPQGLAAALLIVLNKAAAA
jgi:hypothetical protein